MPDHHILDAPRIEVRPHHDGGWRWIVGQWVRNSHGHVDDPCIAKGRTRTRWGGLRRAKRALRREQRRQDAYARNETRAISLDRVQ